MTNNTDMNTVYWTTKDGRVMNVDDMSDTHVRNAFKMLLRNIEKLSKKPKPSPKFTLAGDMAQEFNDTYFADENDEKLDEVWGNPIFFNH